MAKLEEKQLMHYVRNFLNGAHDKDPNGKMDYPSRAYRGMTQADHDRHAFMMMREVPKMHPGHSYVSGSSVHREYVGRDDDGRRLNPGHIVDYKIKNDHTGAITNVRGKLYDNRYYDRKGKMH